MRGRQRGPRLFEQTFQLSGRGIVRTLVNEFMTPLRRCIHDHCSFFRRCAKFSTTHGHSPFDFMTNHCGSSKSVNAFILYHDIFVLDINSRDEESGEN